MSRSPVAALVVLLAACASGGAGGDTRSAPAAPGTAEAASRVTVRVENGTTDQLRITGRDGASLRLQAGQSGCLRLSAGVGRITLLAEPLGGGENRTGISNVSNADVIRSPEFSPGESRAWEWKIGRGALGGNQLLPAINPCD